MDLAQRSRRERFLFESAEELLRSLSQRRFELGTSKGGMHAGRMHLEMGQFGDCFFRQGLCLQTQQLAQFHRRPFQGTKLRAHSS